MMRPRMRWVLGVVTAVAIALFVFGPARAGTTGSISGTVRDAGTGDPVGLASVSIPELKRGAVTDAQGDYFILNIPPGKYSLRVGLLGYVPQVREDVEVIQDFVTKQDFAVQSTVLQNVPEVVVKAERPLIQKDVTGTTKFIAAEDIKNQPLRGYQDAVAQQSGVVNFRPGTNLVGYDNETLNGNLLVLRGGRPNEVAYYVDGFSQQDPLTGFSTTLINSDAIDEIVVQTGGFNAEYGRINSGVVNVVTREGGNRYFGSLEGVSDFASGDWLKAPSRDNNIYAASLGGPLSPSFKQATFYLSGERRWNRDRQPSFVTDQLTYEGQPGLFSDGTLPSNNTSSWSGVGKLTYKPTPLLTLKVGGTYNHEDWQQYLNTYRFNLNHAPRYEDLNYSVYTTWNHSLNDRSYYEVKGNWFTTERTRGDGVYFDDLEAYSRPNGNVRYDQNEALFWYGDQSVDADGNPTGAHVFDDFLRRKSRYVGLAADYANQVSSSMQVKVGGDYQYHTLRYYDHYFPVQLYGPNGTLDNTRDVDHYGYDALGNEINEGDTFADANGNGSYDPGESFQDKNGNGIYDDPLDVPKHPKVASLYGQLKYERLGLVLNAGLRWDYLTPATEALKSDTKPLDPDGINDSRLQAGDLQSSKTYQRLSPRIGVGYPVTDETLLHVNYGKFFQQPNLQDLYVSYAFLEHKIRTGGYFVGFGNPNLKPEETTAYEIGVTHTPTDRSRIEVTAYYKDVKDLVEITNIPSVPNNFSSYQNRDFATIKGIDVAYTLRRFGALAATASYSLSYASGTGSASQTQRNIAWTASNPPKLSSPLAFDQRHKLSANFDYRYQRGQGPIWGGRRWLENTGLNVLINAGSGTPYTPTNTYNEVTLAAVASQPAGPINSRYGPWTFQVDAKLNRVFPVGRQRVEFYVWVLNLFNRENVYTVYTSTGSAETTNYLNTSEGQNFLATNADRYGADGALGRYHLAELDPGNFGVPRLVRFGARIDF